MSVVIRELIKYFERETGKELSNRPYKVSGGKEGDVIILIKGEKPFILKGIKKEDFIKFSAIGDATKIEKLLISAKVNEKPTYYLVGLNGMFLYGIKKTYVCEGNPELVEEGMFLKYKIYRYDNRKYYFVRVPLEATLKPGEFYISMGSPEREEINMEEYLYVLEGHTYDDFFDVLEEMRKEFEKRTIAKEFLTMTKKEIAVGLMRETDNYKFRAWYCSRRSRLPRICENPFAYRAIAIYEQYYQGMKKLQILVFPKNLDSEIKEQ